MCRAYSREEEVVGLLRCPSGGPYLEEMRSMLDLVRCSIVEKEDSHSWGAAPPVAPYLYPDILCI